VDAARMTGAAPQQSRTLRLRSRRQPLFHHGRHDVATATPLAPAISWDTLRGAQARPGAPDGLRVRGAAGERVVIDGLCEYHRMFHSTALRLVQCHARSTVQNMFGDSD